MTSVQPTLLPNDIAERKTGRPRIYTDKEIKEQRKVQMRQYFLKKKETKVNKPKSSVISPPHIYTDIHIQMGEGDVPGRPPYDCPQQTRLYSVLLVPVWGFPLNENTHH